MKLYLSSYKLGNNTYFLKDWLETNGNEILVIPNALDVYPDGERKNTSIKEKCDEIEKLGFKTKILDLKKCFSNNNLTSEIGNTKAFYVLGGNVFVLRQAMKLSGFDEYLKEISDKRDYLYSGFSAGICVLSENLHGLDLADDITQDPYNYGETIWEGIGLLDYTIVPHFDTPNHPESHLMYDVVKYLENNNLKYKTLRDGDVIIDEITAPNQILRK